MTDHDEVWEAIRKAYVRPDGVFGHYGMESRQREYDEALAWHDAQVTQCCLEED